MKHFKTYLLTIALLFLAQWGFSQAQFLNYSLVCWDSAGTGNIKTLYQRIYDVLGYGTGTGRIVSYFDAKSFDPVTPIIGNIGACCGIAGGGRDTSIFSFDGIINEVDRHVTFTDNARLDFVRPDGGRMLYLNQADSQVVISTFNNKGTFRAKLDQLEMNYLNTGIFYLNDTKAYFQDYRGIGLRSGIEYENPNPSEWLDNTLITKKYFLDNNGNGIYGGSGTVQASTSATLESTSDLIKWSDGNQALSFGTSSDYDITLYARQVGANPQSYFQIDPNGFFYFLNSTNEFSLNANTFLLKAPNGIRYYADYSGTYTARSLIDKGFADATYLDDTNTTNTAIEVTGLREKIVTVTDSDANSVIDTFIDLGDYPRPDVEWISDTALIVNDTFIPGTEVGASQDFAILPKIVPDHKNGILYQVYRVAAGHLIDSGYKIILRKSVDGGITWTGTDGTGTHSEYVPSGLGTDRGDPYHPAVSPNTGRLFIFLYTTTSAAAYSENWLVYSDDGGVTFSAPYTYDGGQNAGAPYGNEFCLGESGELLMFHKYNIGGVFHYKILESYDDGLTWAIRSTIITSADLGKNMAEATLKQGKGGTMVLVSRLVALNESGLNQPFICVSQDFGRTWAAENGETLTQQDLEDGLYNSGYLQLEGEGVNLGTNTNSHNCLPDLEIAERNNKEYLIIPYYVRTQSAAYLNSWRITAIGLDQWISQGQGAIDSLIPEVFFTGASPALNSADGNGNIFIDKNLNGIWITGDNQGTSSAGPAYAISGRLTDGLINSMLNRYELDVQRADLLGTLTATTIAGQVFQTSLIDVSSGAATVNPPPTALLKDGYWFAVSDLLKNAASNNITVDFTTATQNLNGSSQDHVISADGGFARFTWSAANSTWFISN